MHHNKTVLSGPDASDEIARALREVAAEIERGDVVASRFEYNRSGALRLILRGVWMLEAGDEL